MSATTSKAEKNSLLEILDAGGGRITLGKPLSKDEFVTLSERFSDLQMEREANGKTNISLPLKKGAAERESTLILWIGLWAMESKTGTFFSSSIGIELPDGSIKSPDCAWVSDERLADFPENDDDEYLRVIPDFVAEVRSSSDRLPPLKRKMEKTWMANGVRLAWIDPYNEKVYIYRQGQEVEEVKGFAGKMLSGENVMPGMELPLEELRRNN